MFWNGQFEEVGVSLEYFGWYVKLKANNGITLNFKWQITVKQCKLFLYFLLQTMSTNNILSVATSLVNYYLSYLWLSPVNEVKSWVPAGRCKKKGRKWNGSPGLVAVRVVRAHSSRDSSGKSSSVDIASRNRCSPSAVGIVGADSSRDSSRVGRDSSGITCRGDAAVRVVWAGSGGDTSGVLGLARDKGGEQTEGDLRNKEWNKD